MLETEEEKNIIIALIKTKKPKEIAVTSKNDHYYIRIEKKK